MLLGWDDTEAGFTDFGMETFPEYQDLFVSGLVWQERQGLRGLGREAGQNQMIIDSKPGYQDRLADCAEEATPSLPAPPGDGCWRHPPAPAPPPVPRLPGRLAGAAPRPPGPG